MYVSISYYETFITNLLIFGPHPTSTTAMIVVIKCVNDNFKPTQDTLILHYDFPSENAGKPVAIPFGVSIIKR